VPDEFLVDLVVLVHRVRSGDVLELGGYRVEMVLVDPRIQPVDCSAQVWLEDSGRFSLTGVDPPHPLLIDYVPPEFV
jgi:hypothetical protein